MDSPVNSKKKDQAVLAAFKPCEQLNTAQVLIRVHCMSWAQVFRSMIRLEKRGYLQRVWDDTYEEVATEREFKNLLRMRIWQLELILKQAHSMKLFAADAV